MGGSVGKGAFNKSDNLRLTPERTRTLEVEN